MVDSKKSKEKEEAFTLEHTNDHTGTGAAPVPSITQLLYIKPQRKTKTSQGSQDSPDSDLPSGAPPSAPPSAPMPDSHPVAPSTPSGPMEISLDSSMSGVVLEQSAPSPASLSAPTQLPTGQKAKRRAKSKKLILWTLKQLATGSDPLAKGLAYMVNRGIRSALFLAIQPPPPGARAPLFQATATVQPANKLELWTGLQWNPLFEAEMWNLFIKTGYVEFSPPGTSTNLSSTRNVTRAAFGIRQEEWLLFARVGPPDACRGIVAMVSDKSMIHEVVGAMDAFAKPIV